MGLQQQPVVAVAGESAGSLQLCVMRQLQFDGRTPSEHTPHEPQAAATPAGQQQQQEQQQQQQQQQRQQQQQQLGVMLPAGVKFVTVRWLSDSLAAGSM
jgi:hypothetical protein